MYCNICLAEQKRIAAKIEELFAVLDSISATSYKNKQVYKKIMMSNPIDRNKTKDESETKTLAEESFFDSSEMEALLFWRSFCNTAVRIEKMANLALQNERKKTIVQENLRKIIVELDYIKNKLLSSYSLFLDTTPEHTNCVVETGNYCENLTALYFWSLDYQNELEYVVNNFTKFPGNLKNTIFAKNFQQEISRISDITLSLFSLAWNAVCFPLQLLQNFDAYLNAFRKSNKGEYMVLGWRRDFALPQDQFLLRLKEIKSFQPWVDKCRWLHEGKIERQELFVDITIPGAQHNPLIDRTNSWLSIFAIMSILTEYDEYHSSSKTKSIPNGNSKIGNTPEAAIRRCLEKLMKESISTKKSGRKVEELLFNLQNHWQAVYRILVDKKYCKNADYEGFDSFIERVIPEMVNKPYKKESVKQISKTDFNIPFEKWEYNGETSGNRKVYVRMYNVAQRFKELLEEEGL